MNFEYNFDNREFDTGGNLYTNSMTINAARLTPLIGIKVNETGQLRHKLLSGIDIMKEMGKAPVGNGDEGSSHLDMFSLEMFENIAYIMAKHADPTIPDSPEEWLDEFSTFSIYQVLPKIIELWGLNVQTDVESKKTLRN